MRMIGLDPCGLSWPATRSGWLLPMAACGAIAGLVEIASAQSETPCAQEIGPAQASGLVRRCTEISPATHPPCNAANSCAVIRAEIQRGCEIAGADAPGWCKTYTQP